MAGFLSSRKLSLRGAAVKDEEDRKRKADIELKMEKKEDLVTKKKKQEEKSKKELEEQFKMINLMMWSLVTATKNVKTWRKRGRRKRRRRETGNSCQS